MAAIAGRCDPSNAWQKRGYFCISIEYRLSKEAKWQAQIQDCKAAVRWLRANATKINVDPNRIAVGGESAGGHLAACLGTMAGVKEYEGDGGYSNVNCTVQAVVIYGAPTAFCDPANCTPLLTKVVEGLMGVPFPGNPEAWKRASPVNYVQSRRSSDDPAPRQRG